MMSKEDNNDRERIKEQLKLISRAADQLDQHIEMLRVTGLNYAADSMARSIAEIKRCKEVIQQIIAEENEEEEEKE